MMSRHRQLLVLLFFYLAAGALYNAGCCFKSAVQAPSPIAAECRSLVCADTWRLAVIDTIRREIDQVDTSMVDPAELARVHAAADLFANRFAAAEVDFKPDGRYAVLDMTDCAAMSSDPDDEGCYVLVLVPGYGQRHDRSIAWDEELMMLVVDPAASPGEADSAWLVLEGALNTWETSPDQLISDRETAAHRTIEFVRGT